MILAMTEQHFQEHYNEHFDDVYRFVRFRITHPPTADDLTAAIWLRAWKGRSQYAPSKGTFRNWIFGIARFTLIDHWRADKPTIDLDTIEHTLSDALDTEQNTDARLFFDQVMDSLTDHGRLLLTLRYIDDLTYAEIADATGKTPSAVRQFFSRIHRTLKEQFPHFDQ